jgi:hypothetical protein
MAQSHKLKHLLVSTPPATQETGATYGSWDRIPAGYRVVAFKKKMKMKLKLKLKFFSFLKSYHSLAGFDLTTISNLLRGR